MKLLLSFIICLSLTATAQTKKDSDSIWKRDSIWILGRPITFNFRNEPKWASREPNGKDYFVEAMLKLYSRYEKDRYADSTWMTKTAFIRLAHRLSEYEITREDDNTLYLRGKPTLPGFIEFLRRQK